MPKRFVFLFVGFLVLAGVVGVCGILYFEGGNDDPEEAPAGIATLTENQQLNTSVPLTNTAIYEAYMGTEEAINLMATSTASAQLNSMPTTTMAANSLDIPTATATLTKQQQYQTSIPMTNTALYEAYMGTRESLDLKSTGTAEALSDAVSVATPTPNP